MPLYAEIRHGPIEYGKDIVVLVKEGNKVVLQMYQAKAGDITKRNWPEARDQLEEMFQVDMSPVQLPVTDYPRHGILVFNGHLNTYVEPVVEGWLKEQRLDHGRDFTILHLDALVTWIVDTGLINEIPVGTALAGGPPDRSRRAGLAHRAPALGSGGEAHAGVGMHNAGRG